MSSNHEALLLRHVTDIRRDGDEVRITVSALPAARLPGTPGWLTGEPMRAQGLEVDWPNLPAQLDLPPVAPEPF